MLTASGKHCFVIMPFSTTADNHTTEYWTKFFFDFIKPAVEKHGYTCDRSSADPGNIMKKIVNQLVTSDVVLAVLTDYNPNVMYELGTRHATKRGTIMIIEHDQDIPFDIKQYGVIYYNDQIAGLPKFEEHLRNAIQKIEKSQDPDSPAQDFLIKYGTPSTSDKVPLKEIEKRSLADKRQVIYNDLDKNIFSPLLRLLYRRAYITTLDRIKLYYDLSSLKENPDYEEAKLHWEQDLKDIGIDPKRIESQVDGLNTDIDRFFTSQIREPVIAAITTGGIFTAFESGTDIPALNQISIPNVIKELQSDWIEGTGVDQRYEKDTHYYLLGNAIIATVEPQDETRLDHIINSLRSKDNLISHHIQAFKERRATILDDVMKMNREIDKRIINRISKKLYKTTCPMCDDNVLIG